MANKVLGMHRLKNKVNRNAFDLSHRHMFTAQVGELLPVFSQWVNPNETFKIGYNGKTRTAALNTDAFTRIRENIQYYFVPFQSLWKYFEQQVNNMTKGDAGQNISKFASSSTDASQISTSLPYISYVDLGNWLAYMVNHAVNQIRQQQRLNELQIAGNIELANYSQNLQKDMWNYTNYENQIKNLKAAGLNPALMYAKGGVGGQTGSANAGQVAGSHASSETEREAIGIQRNAIS